MDDVIVEATETAGRLEGAVRCPDGTFEILKMYMSWYSLGSKVWYLMDNPLVSESYYVMITIENPGVKEYVLDPMSLSGAEVMFRTRKMSIPAWATRGTLKVTKFEHGGRIITGHIRVGYNGYDMEAKFEVDM